MDRQLILTRFINVGLEVQGELMLPDGQKIITLENKNYLFNNGNYTINYETSDKFKRKLWEFKDIHGRSEIKFHRGDHIHQSTGCILLRKSDLDRLHSSLDSTKTYNVQVVSQEKKITFKT